MSEGDADLYKGAVDLAIQKSMEDLRTLLTWVEKEEDPEERVRHVERAIELLEEIRLNLEETG